MIHLTDADVMTVGGYWLGSFATGWVIGRIHLVFRQISDKLQ